MAKSTRSSRILARDLDQLVAEVRHCRICVDAPDGAQLAHDPNPVFQVSTNARLAIFGQAPGLRAHDAGRPFADPSGDRLREWMGIDEALFYDPQKLAIVPMGFCFPGYDAKGSDLPPRKECASAWRDKLLACLPGLELALLVGGYAQSWHLGRKLPNGKPRTLTGTVADWRSVLVADRRLRYLPLPHPSWRNNAWIARNPWFRDELLPELKTLVAQTMCET
ncbi:MAG: uracil-DNA glycosylase family protein [Filomicrobium sp.]